MAAEPSLKTRVLFRSKLIQAISDMEDERGTLEDALNRIRETFFFAISKRKEPQGKITRFSVSLWDKGKLTLFRVKAITTFGNRGKLIVIDVLPDAELFNN